MKIAKLIMIFSVVIFAIIGAMLVLEIIDLEQALDFSGKTIALIVITGGMLYAITKVTNSKEKASQNETSEKPGPKF